MKNQPAEPAPPPTRSLLDNPALIAAATGRSSKSTAETPPALPVDPLELGIIVAIARRMKATGKPAIGVDVRADIRQAADAGRFKGTATDHGSITAAIRELMRSRRKLIARGKEPGTLELLAAGVEIAAAAPDEVGVELPAAAVDQINAIAARHFKPLRSQRQAARWLRQFVAERIPKPTKKPKP